MGPGPASPVPRDPEPGVANDTLPIYRDRIANEHERTNTMFDHQEQGRRAARDDLSGNADFDRFGGDRFRGPRGRGRRPGGGRGGGWGGGGPWGGGGAWAGRGGRARRGDVRA